MSQLLFPMPSAPQGSWTWPVKKTPAFKTLIQTPASSRAELRIALQAYPIWKFEYDFSYLKGDLSGSISLGYGQEPYGESPYGEGIISTSALQGIAGFYSQLDGAADDWLFADPYDQNVDSAQFGVGDGNSVSFQLIRNIGGMADIIQNVNGNPAISINGVLQSPSTYTISSLGSVTFGTPPAVLSILTWSGQFFFRCRFDEDELPDLEEFLYQVWELHSLKFRSVIL